VERVLICLLCKTRAHRVTFPSFKRQVLDELNGDLALSLMIDEKYDYANPFWQHAKYRWTAPDFTDVGDAFDLAQRRLYQESNVEPPNWRLLLRLKGTWQGKIRTADPQPSAASVLPFCRWLLLNGLQQDYILDRYDRFVITRSDFVWSCPHPPLSILDRDAIWLPAGEDYGGVNDRHLIVSRDNVVNCLNMIEDVLLRPNELYEDMKRQSDNWNDEQFLAHHLDRKGLLQRVKRFPCVMYTVRQATDESPTWQRGRYEGAVGHYIKYENEFHAARSNATIIRCRSDWENRIWMQFDPASVVPLRPSLPLRLWYSFQSIYFSILSALRRPGRLARIVRFCRGERLSPGINGWFKGAVANSPDVGPIAGGTSVTAPQQELTG
jgi:hypothetical protein